MNDMVLRQAVQRDAADLAILDDMAAHGLSSWLWYGAVQRGDCDTAYERGRERMGDPNDPFGFPSAVVAEIDGLVAGMAISYAMAQDWKPASMGPVADAVLNPMFDLMMHARGHWFIDTIAIYNAYRSKGLAKKLLTAALERGISRQAVKVSLLCQSDNQPVLNLYRSLGFNVTDKRPYTPFGENQETENWLLLSRPL